MPETLRDDIFAYVQRVVEVCEFLFQATDQLKTLTEDEFFGPSADQVMEIIAKADHAEWEADKAQYRLAQRLFALDDELKPTDIFLWSGIMRELGTLANNADKTGERLRRMLGR
jgi:hypothetical protein